MYLFKSIKNNILNIFIIGSTSTGKSSLINGLFANAIICTSSIQRDTVKITKYQFRTDASNDVLIQLANDLEENYIHNKKIRETGISSINVDTLKKIHNCAYMIPNQSLLSDFDIYDFPGLDDIDDYNNNFIQIIKHNIHLADILLFVTDANRPLINTSEFNQMKEIIEIINHENNNGHYVNFALIINKFDNINDPDINEMCDKITKRDWTILQQQLHVFRISSHKELICRTKILIKDLYIP